MKKAFILLGITLALSACGSKTGNGSTQSGSDTSQGGGGGGGAGNFPAKSNLDTTIDSTHMPAHVDSAGKKK